MSSRETQPTTNKKSPSTSKKYDPAIESDYGNDHVHIARDDSFQCICGGKDLTDWIACDNSDCPIRWYHLECLNMKKVPPGEWLCPRCRPSIPSREGSLSNQPSIRRPVFPNLVESSLPVEQHTTPKKGVAIKKGVEPSKTTLGKGKPRWKGWVEVSPEEEDEFKQKVEQPWEGATLPRRTRHARGGAVETTQPCVPREEDRNHPSQTPNEQLVREASTMSPVQSRGFEPGADKMEGVETSKGGTPGRSTIFESIDKNDIDLSLYGGFVAWRSTS